MRRWTPKLLGLAGLALVALAVGLFLGRCDSYGIFPLLVAGHALGSALIGAALILGFKPGVAMSILLGIAVAAISFLVAAMALFASFARCFEF
ncbi:hypothetical protein ABT294_28105 [Nonomuraea sp. NPDC000554]|uniref:hypothetical protein n=1 Tax=Nonomuraea sp. NPDC000554 TaxID=3154259 RepID=UPI003319ECFC